MLRFYKGQPTDYIIKYSGGNVSGRGTGLSFFYWLPTTTLVQVPLASSDIPFAFNEITADFQAVTVQGQITYRVTEPTNCPQSSPSWIRGG